MRGLLNIFCDNLSGLETVEDLVPELRGLTPDQLDRVAKVVREIAGGVAPARSAMGSPSVVEQAVRNGWPVSFFTDVVGQISEDFERPAQPPDDARQVL